jgi:hypothetical protein
MTYVVHYSPGSIGHKGICQRGFLNCNTTPVRTTVKHKVTCKRCKKQLKEMAKTHRAIVRAKYHLDRK